MGTILEATYRHGQPPTVLRDRQGIAAFLDDLMAAGWEYTSATVYAVEEGADGQPDHELVVGADAMTGMGAVRYSGDSGVHSTDEAGEWFSRGDHVNPDGVEFAYFGTGHQWPADSEIPLDLVREALWELLTNPNRRPDCLTWQPAPQ